MPELGDKRPSILVVDDLDDMVELLAEYFTGLGFDVATATDAKTGLALASERPPSVVIMDLAMPGFDGCEATRILKSRPETKTIPLIVVTANVAGKHVDAAWAAGADAVLAKPLELLILGEVVAHAITHGSVPRRYSVVPRH